MEETKSITFDKKAQDELPKHIKDKMRADRKQAEEEQLFLQGGSKPTPEKKKKNKTKNNESGVYGRPDWVDDM